MDLPTIFLLQQEIKRGLNNLDRPTRELWPIFWPDLVAYFEMSKERMENRFRCILADSNPENFSFSFFLSFKIQSQANLVLSIVTSRDTNTKNLVPIPAGLSKNFIDDSPGVTFRRRVGIFLNCCEQFLARRFLNPNSSIIHEDSKIAESREYRHLRLAFAPLITQLLHN